MAIIGEGFSDNLLSIIFKVISVIFRSANLNIEAIITWWVSGYRVWHPSPRIQVEIPLHKSFFQYYL